jgi:hypothetical protein
MENKTDYWKTKVVGVQAKDINKKCLCGCNNYVNKGYNFMKGHAIRLEENQNKIKYAKQQKSKLTGKNCWCHGLTKETDDRLRSAGEKLSNIRKRLYQEGKLKKIRYWLGKKMPKFSEEHKRKIVESTRKSGGYIRTPERIIQFKELRKRIILPLKDTSIEIKIQSYLKQLGIQFFTHQYIREIEHGYQCDILIPVQEGIKQKTIIECDGDYWHGNPYFFKMKGKEIPQVLANRRKLDFIKTRELLDKGYRVIRLTEKGIRILEINEFKSILEVKNGTRTLAE